MQQAFFNFTADGNGAIKGGLVNNAFLAHVLGTEASKMTPQKARDVVAYVSRCVEIRRNAILTFPVDYTPTGTDEPLDLAEIEGGALGGNTWLADVPEILAHLEESLLLEGAGYVLIGRKGGRITGLLPLDPTTIKPDFTENGLVRFKRKWKVGGEQKEQAYKPEEILHVFEPSVYTEQGAGRIPFNAALTNARALHGLDDFLGNYAERGLIKGTVLTVDMEGNPRKKLPDGEKERLVRAWRGILKGFRGNPEQVEVVTSRVKPVTVGEGINDLSNTSISEDQKKSIATAFGISDSLVISSAANFATASVDLLQLYTLTVIPRLPRLLRAVNTQLLKYVSVTARAVPRRLEALQTEQLEQAKAVKEITGRPVLTVNEGRALLGFEPIDGGDELPTAQPQAPAQAAMSAERRLAQNRVDVHRELKAWRAHVLAGRTDDFRITHVPIGEANVIKARLLTGMDANEAFKYPFVDL